MAHIIRLVEPSIKPMPHKKFDEIVLHTGGDPGDPENLVGNMQFEMGDDLLTFDKCYAKFTPRDLKHCSLIWNKVRKPYIEMAEKTS